MKTDKKVEKKGYKVANIGGEKYIHEDTVNEIVIRAVEDGVRGFAEYLMQDMDKDSYHSKESINSAWNEYSWDIERTYLQSLDKGEE